MTKEPSTFDQLKEQFNHALLSSDHRLLTSSFNELEVYALDTKDYDLLGTIYALTTGLFHSQLRMDLFIKYAVRLLDYANSYKELLDYEDYYAVAALIDYELENYDQAKAHVQKEIEIHDRNDHKRGRATRQNNLTEIEILQGNYNKALNLALDSKALLSEIGYSTKMQGYENKSIIAKCYIQLGDYDRALTYLTDILNWPHLDGHPMLKVELYTSFALYHFKLDHKDDAIMYYQEAIELSQEGGFAHNLQQLHLDIATTYAAYKDYGHSYEHMKSHIDFLESWKKSNLLILRQNAELEVNLLHREKELYALKQKIQKEKINSDFDRLTHAYNRQYGLNLIKRLIETNSFSHATFSVLVLEIPCLKRVNELKGIHETENLLIDIADLLHKFIKSNQHVIRYDLYKFVLIFEDEDVNLALSHGQKLIKQLKTISYEIDHHLKTICIHGGLIDYNKAEGTNPSDLVRMASLAAYQSEKIGDNTITIW